MSRAIGIFDSGIGGLTVLKEIVQRLPGEDIIYLGDTARVPYGIRSPETVTRYSFENTRFLLAQEIAMLVVACNTASAVSLETLKKEFPIPILGVLEPGARAAAAATRSRTVGVIGTEATTSSGAYERAITAMNPDIRVISVACPLFVPLVEEGWTSDAVIALVAKRYLGPLRDKKIDTLVLGCTHYPLLKGLIGKIMGKKVTLIDSATETAREVERMLAERGEKKKQGSSGVRKYFVTDAPARFEKMGTRFLGSSLVTAEQVMVGGV